MLPTNPLLNATAPAGPHLPVALLRQYAAGTLAPAAQHRVEAHTLACPRCADILAGLLQTPAATTNQALAQLQQRLRQRVQQVAPARPLVVAPRRHRWLAPQLAAAAALILGLVAAGWWTWQQRQRPAAPVAAQYPAAPAAVVEPTSPAASTKSARATSPLITLNAKHKQAETKNKPEATRRTPGSARGEFSSRKHRPTTSESIAGSTAGQPTPRLSAAPPTASDQRGTPDTITLARPMASQASAPVAITVPTREGTTQLRAAMPAPPALPATPSGGYAALREYLKKGAAEFEPASRDGGRQAGRVLVRLHLGADGKIEQAEAVRKLRPDYDAEAVRLLREGPGWVPGITAGRRAAQVVEVPVVFE